MHLISKIIAYGVFGLFLVVLGLATVFAYSRGYSGATGLSMAKVQKMRTETTRQTAQRGS